MRYDSQKMNYTVKSFNDVGKSYYIEFDLRWKIINEMGSYVLMKNLFHVDKIGFKFIIAPRDLISVKIISLPDASARGVIYLE